MLIGFAQLRCKINFILAYNKMIKRHIKFCRLNWNKINASELRLKALFMGDELLQIFHISY